MSRAIVGFNTEIIMAHAKQIKFVSETRFEPALDVALKQRSVHKVKIINLTPKKQGDPSPIDKTYIGDYP